MLTTNFYDSYDYITTLAQDNNLAYQAQADYDLRYVFQQCPERSAQNMLTGQMARTLTDTPSSRKLYTSFYYDANGNIIQSHKQNILGGHDHYYYKLTFTGIPIQIKHIHTTPDTIIIDEYFYTYDNMERILSVSLLHNGQYVTLNQNTYNRLGQLHSQTLGTTIPQTINYQYNIQGQPTTITNQHFTQTIHYQDTYGQSTPCYNGNISAIEWQAKDALSTNTPTQHHYEFEYDNQNKLVGAYYGATDALNWNGSLILNNARDYNCAYEYDLNSNPTTITRKGVTHAMPVVDYTFWQYGYIDNLQLTYQGNQLIKVTDQANSLAYSGSMDFKDNSDKTVEFTYDANGNMTSDMNKKIYRITYNILNQPYQIYFKDGHIIKNTYAADGRRLRVEYLVSNIAFMDPEDDIEIEEPVNGKINPTTPRLRDGGLEGGIIDSTAVFEQITTIMTRSYCDNYIYRNTELERVLNDYGYYGDTCYYYHIKDYQGNIRATINHMGTLKEINNYYPYGGLMGQATSIVQPYKYNSKELDRENGLDWYDFAARRLDPMLTRFATPDPKCEHYYSLSPYTYCAANPIRFTDPTGQRIITSIDGTAYEYRIGADGCFGFYDRFGQQYTGSDQYANDLVSSLSLIAEGEAGEALLTKLIDAEEYVVIQKSTKRRTSKNNNYITVKWENSSPSKGPGLIQGEYVFKVPKFVSLSHELGHALDYVLGTIDLSEWYSIDENGVHQSVAKAEWFACYIENAIRIEHNLPFRTHYSYRKDQFDVKYIDTEPFLPIPFDTYRMLFPLGYRVFPISQWLLK